MWVAVLLLERGGVVGLEELGAVSALGDLEDVLAPGVLLEPVFLA